MKASSAHFETLEADELREINGGAFAYDVGRVIRYFVISGGGVSLIGVANGIADWIACDIANQIANS
jgi:hypothetical protein